MRRLAFLALGLLLIVGCSDGEGQPSPTETKPKTGATQTPVTPPPVKTEPGTGATQTPVTPPPTGLSQYDSSSSLVVKGRDRLRACVESLEDTIRVEDAVGVIQDALLAATEDSQWPDEFGTPVVDAGCPLPPVALELGEFFFRRHLCLDEVGPYLVYVFVADASRLTERFSDERVALTSGVRKAEQERMGQFCGLRVSESWYLTPDDLGDADLLRRNIFGETGIFTIARFPE